MNTLEAIASRRSIRRFQNKPVPRELIEQILEATTKAPSGKNRQPWRFVVVEGGKRTEMVGILRDALARFRDKDLPTGSAEWTANSMEQAPVTVLFFNGESANKTPEHDWTVPDVQSIGGAIQTMLLVAEDLGLGTLWICDIFYAYEELRSWLGREDAMIAAVSIGYADESPGPRPRKPWQELTTWLAE
jgi:nitroreductase